MIVILKPNVDRTTREFERIEMYIKNHPAVEMRLSEIKGAE